MLYARSTLPPAYEKAKIHSNDVITFIIVIAYDIGVMITYCAVPLVEFGVVQGLKACVGLNRPPNGLPSIA